MDTKEQQTKNVNGEIQQKDARIHLEEQQSATDSLIMIDAVPVSVCFDDW